MNFNDKLNNIIVKNNSLLCVGLDPDIKKLPAVIKKSDYSFFEFNKAIIDSTHDLVCAYKPNPAFYEAYGNKGIVELKMTCNYLQQHYPEIPIIIDAKRGDIGNTNEGYVKYVFDYFEADAITVMPYMGIESLSPYFHREGKGIIVGCHSSNPGAREFQEQFVLMDQGKSSESRILLYELVASELIKKHGSNPNVLIFMGATYPEQLINMRKIIGDMNMLVPGVGAQGGDIKTFVEAGINSKKTGLIINSSRSILYASNGEDFAEKAREETLKLRDEINKYRN